MSTEALIRLRSEIMGLPEAERAELAHDLIASLDSPRDLDADRAWDREIMRRISAIDAGQAALIDRNELRKRLRARLKIQ